MKNKLIVLIVSLSVYPAFIATSQEVTNRPDLIKDGPYIFFQDSLLKAKWIRNGILKEVVIAENNFPQISRRLDLHCNYRDLTEDYSLNPDYIQNYGKIKSIAVITDLHGEFKTYKKLLLAMGIIDKDLNWTYGAGHLVVLGDIFDRGEMVTEILWHLFTLEKQAAAAGGMVHVLLGNHEIMSMYHDLTYTNIKYRKVEAIINSRYSDLYSQNTVLGRWLRTRPVVITIDSILFVHGGISVELAREKIGVQKINKIFSDYFAGKMISASEIGDAEVLTAPENDPLWYRGYFTDSTFCESRLDSILDFYKIEKIVVGHTSFEELMSFYSNKIVGADAGIMNHQKGEMLIYDQGVFYKGLHNGRKIRL
jgi:hypothetical protein